MAKVSVSTVREILLRLTEQEAEYLRDYLQNDLTGDDDPTHNGIRCRLFELLKRALQQK